MKNATTLILALATILVSSCTKPAIHGGKTVTKERHIEANYDGITISGSFDMKIVDDESFDIRIECSENLLPYIETYVHDGELYITEKHNNVYGNTTRRIYVSKSSLNRLRNEGSGNIHGELENSTFLDIENHGSGNIELSCSTDTHVFLLINGSGNMDINGSTKNLEISIKGSGNIDALTLTAENGDVSITGSGNAMVNTSENLQVDIDGSGNVLYVGNPSLQVHITGSGEVKPY